MKMTEFGGILNQILFPKSYNISLVFDFLWPSKTHFLKIFWHNDAFFKDFWRLYMFVFMSETDFFKNPYVGIDIMLDHLLTWCFWFLKVWDRVPNIVTSGPSKSPISPTYLNPKNQRSVLLLVSMEMLQLELNYFWLWQNFSA